MGSGRLPMNEMEKYYLRGDGTTIRAHLRSFNGRNDLGDPICEMEVIVADRQNSFSYRRGFPERFVPKNPFRNYFMVFPSLELEV